MEETSNDEGLIVSELLGEMIDIHVSNHVELDSSGQPMANGENNEQSNADLVTDQGENMAVENGSETAIGQASDSEQVTNTAEQSASDDVVPENGIDLPDGEKMPGDDDDDDDDEKSKDQVETMDKETEEAVEDSDEMAVDAEPEDDSDSVTEKENKQQADKQPNGDLEAQSEQQEDNNTNNDGAVEDDEEGPEWVVEKILDKKLDSKGFAKYLVKWEGFKSSENTWEPVEFLAECDGKMREYELERAEKLATETRDQTGLTVTKNPQDKSKNGRSYPRHKRFEVGDIMGLVKARSERYFLFSLANTTQKAFIRNSLARILFPGKVIDFYVKNVRWRQAAVTQP